MLFGIEIYEIFECKKELSSMTSNSEFSGNSTYPRESQSEKEYGLIFLI